MLRKALVLLMLLSACGGTPDVLVTLADPEHLAAGEPFKITVELEGKASKPIPDQEVRRHPFTLRLPAGSKGRLRVRVSSGPRRGCVQLDLDGQGGDHEVTLALQQLRCPNSLPCAIGAVPELKRVFGVSTEQLWITGTQGTVLLRDGEGWSAFDLPLIDGRSPTFNGIWGAAGDDVWIVGGVGDPSRAVVLRWNGCQLLPTEAPNGAGLASVFGRANELWVGGEGPAIYTRRGSRWELGSLPPDAMTLKPDVDQPNVKDKTTIMAIGSGNPNRLYAAVYQAGAELGGMVLQSDGGGLWRQLGGLVHGLRDIAGTSTSTWFAAEAKGQDDKKRMPPVTLDAYQVGLDDIVKPERLPSKGAIYELYGIWLNDQGQGWAVGYGPTFVQWPLPRNTVHPSSSDGREYLTDVWGNGKGEFYAVGSLGAIWRLIEGPDAMWTKDEAMPVPP